MFFALTSKVRVGAVGAGNEEGDGTGFTCVDISRIGRHRQRSRVKLLLVRQMQLMSRSAATTLCCADFVPTRLMLSVCAISQWPNCNLRHRYGAGLMDTSPSMRNIFARAALFNNV